MKLAGVVALSVVMGIGIGAALFFRPTVMTSGDQSQASAELPLSEVRKPDNLDDSPVTEERRSRLEEIEAVLAREKLAREALAKEVAALKQAISAMQTAPPPWTPSELSNSTSAGEPGDETARDASLGAAPPGGDDSIRKMIALGVPPETAELVRRRNDQLNLTRLQLQDRASREGWVNTDRFREEDQNLDRQEEQLRREVGEDAYDRFLYVMGQENRVRVEDVMVESPAAAAGLQLGDVIYAYDKKRVFSWPELRAAIAEGRSGEQVSVTIQRGDELRDVYLPRGPMGVRLETVRISPELKKP